MECFFKLKRCVVLCNFVTLSWCYVAGPMDYLNKLGKQAENMAGNLWGHGMILLYSLLFFTLVERLLRKPKQIGRG